MRRQTVAVSATPGIVRRASEDDLDAVLEFERRDPAGREYATLLATRVRSGEVLLFESSGRLLGYAVLRPTSFFDRDFVELLVVGAHDRRHGIGSLLLREAAAQSTTARIFTSTNRSNTPMIRLLEQMSWRRSGELEGIDDGDPELVFFNDTS